MTKINIGCNIDLEKLIDSRLLIQANSGGGKSYTVRKILEETHGKVMSMVLDTEGEYHTLREEYDFLLIGGKSGDVPVNLKAAKLLPRKILELKVPTIVDMSDLKKPDRIAYVKDYLSALMESGKEYWQPCLVVVTEAHNFAGQQEKQDSTWALIDLMTRGRKRGFCGILETQRISKLHKDAAAECNNKLVGRTFLDIDMKRAAEELGFSAKQDMLSLRDLKPGEFYAFGTAIKPHHVHKVVIEKSRTTHPKVGMDIKAKIVPPTPKIKQTLTKLSELPQEVEKELKEKKDMIAEINRLKMELKARPHIKMETIKDEKFEREVKVFYERQYKEEIRKLEDHYKKTISDLSKYGGKLAEKIETIGKILGQKTELSKPVTNVRITAIPLKTYTTSKPSYVHMRSTTESQSQTYDSSVHMREDGEKLGLGEKKILTSIAQHTDGVTKEQLTVLTGYKRSSRDAYLQRLSSRGYVIMSDGRVRATDEGIAILGPDFEPLPIGDALREHWMARLPEGEKKILHVLIDAYPELVDRETLTDKTGYQRSSRDAYIQRLNARKLVVREGTKVRASEELFG